jgi:amino acid adenylation domain-containing protein
VPDMTAAAHAMPSVLPSDHARRPNAVRTRAHLTHHCAADLAADVAASARAHECTLIAECVASLIATISRYSRDDEATVDVSQRLRSAVLGESVEQPTGVLRIAVDTTREPDLRTLTTRTHNALLTARTPTEAPEGGIALAIGGDAPTGGDWEVAFGVTVTDACVEYHASYDSALFHEATIRRFLRSAELLLRSAVAEPRRALVRLPIVDPQEREMMLTAWNATQTVFDGSSHAHRLFEAQVERSPDAIAVEFEGEMCTYAEMNVAANALANDLVSAGVAANRIVAVCMRRSRETVVTLLAIHKAGGAFLPIDVDLPRDRIRFKLEDTGCLLLVTQPSEAQRVSELVSGLPITVREVPEVEQLTARRVVANLADRSGSEDLAYVMYTSGSTGRPKGVEVVHGGLSNHVQWFAQRLEMSPKDRMLQHASLSFDASIPELFVPLHIGATVVCAPAGTHRDLLALPQLLQRLAISVVQMVPSALRIAVGSSALRACSSLRYLVSGGEALDAALCADIRQQLPALRLGNFYGPTEITVDATSYELIGEIDPSTPVPIGTPVANACCRILDPFDGLVPIGVAGELRVGGRGVARGYLNLPERTAARFSDDPFEPGQRLYRTGDLVRYRPDGNIEYIGRVDTQVKLRGYRIELLEVEAPLLLHPHVKQATVSTWSDASGDVHLVAYVVTDGETEVPERELRTLLREQLPQYMVPSAIVFMPDLPRLENGKLNRAALPAPAPVLPEVGDAALFDDPLEKSLQSIWERMLGVRPIGPDDDFFSLGGQSLKAIRVLAEVEAVHGIALRAATLFDAPTIPLLAARMREGQPREVTTLIPVQPRGTRTPLFFAPGGGGELFVFEPLARAIGADQPFFVLDMYVFDEISASDAPLTLADVAARMITDMRSVQAHGPYQLAGYSLGGNIVFEMAQQLRAAGEAVHLVTLIDCDGPDYPHMQPFVTRTLKHLRYATSLGPAGMLRYVRERVGKLGRYLGRAEKQDLNLYADQAEVEMVPQHVIAAVEEALAPVLKAWEAYVPRFYGGEVLVIRASVRPFMIGVVDDDPLLGWGPIVGGLRQEEIVGDHLSIVNPRDADRLANVLRPYLLP